MLSLSPSDLGSLGFNVCEVEMSHVSEAVISHYDNSIYGGLVFQILRQVLYGDLFI